MSDFKCRVCGCTEYHTREVDGQSVDKIIELRNPKIDARIILRACADCKVVFADWGSFKDATDISQKEKDIAKEVLQ